MTDSRSPGLQNTNEPIILVPQHKTQKYEQHHQFSTGNNLQGRLDGHSCRSHESLSAQLETLRPVPAYPMDMNFGGIYSKVTVFRDEPSSGFAFREDPFDTAVISVAALNLCRQRPGKKTITNHEFATGDADEPLTEDGKVVMLNKIRIIYRIALDNDHDSIVLGVWGCGVFKHNPEQIDRMFLDILSEEEFRNRFREVRFAVLGEKNYDGFKKVLD